MKKEVMLYYFSPTGGTKKVGESFCAGLAEKTQAINLGMKDYDIPSVTGHSPPGDLPDPGIKLTSRVSFFGRRILYPRDDHISVCITT